MTEINKAPTPRTSTELAEKTTSFSLEVVEPLDYLTLNFAKQSITLRQVSPEQANLYRVIEGSAGNENHQSVLVANDILELIGTSQEDGSVAHGLLKFGQPLAYRLSRLRTVEEDLSAMLSAEEMADLKRQGLVRKDATGRLMLAQWDGVAYHLTPPLDGGGLARADRTSRQLFG